MRGRLYLPDELKDFVLYDEGYTDRMKGCLIHFYNYMYRRYISCPIKRNNKGYSGISINKNIVNVTYKQERINNVRYHIYYEILEFLLEQKFIENIKSKNGKSYAVGVKSKHYGFLDRALEGIKEINLDEFPSKVKESYLKIPKNVLFYTPKNEVKVLKRIKIKKISDDNLFVTFDENNKKTVSNNICVIRTCEIMQDIYTNILNKDNLEKHLSELSEEKSYEKAKYIKNMKLSPYCSISDKTGRLFSNFTGLDRNIRENCLDYKWSLDVSNAQFVFLCVLIKNDLEKLDDTTVKFIKMCSEGTIYEHMMKILNKKRDYVKTWMYRLAFDTKLSKYEEWGTLGNKEMFKNEFPQVFDYMKNFQSKKGISIVTALQQIESDIFVENLLKEFIEDYNILSLHDSVYCFDDRLDVELVEEKLIEICNTLNIGVNIHKIVK